MKENTFSTGQTGGREFAQEKKKIERDRKRNSKGEVKGGGKCLGN